MHGNLQLKTATGEAIFFGASGRTDNWQHDCSFWASERRSILSDSFRSNISGEDFKMSAKSLPTFLITLIAVLMFSTASIVQAQTPVATSATLPAAEVERIIKTFTAKESEFRRALNEYAFKRDAVLQSLGMGGQITGEYHRVSLFTFDDQGNRYEKINYFPMPSFNGAVTQEDLDDLGGIQPFALDPSKIPQYDFKYVGKDKIDELNLYVFDVSPKVMPDPKKTKERYFQGRIWVDDQDFQIVKTKGKGVPETKKNKFPTVETYREQIDGRYWFPTYSYADEELVFEDGNALHIRLKVRYTDFELARAKVKVIEVDDLNKPKTQPTPPVNTPRKP
jgi:muconolactone delta-isomerase